ncbi:hypothetical protein FRC14_007173 [Serendipita sp. 396]|nr:hypothetical protein FRC14_007173 [Serendipita sp. 396]
MDPTKLITAVSHAKITQYVSGVGATLYFYDYFLTLGAEVELFWNSKGGWLLRLLVIAIRYLPVLGFPIALLSSNPLVSSLPTSAYATAFTSFRTTIDGFSFDRCRFSIVGGIIFQALSGVTSTALFTMRVSTLYESRPKVQRFVVAAFWITTAAQIAITIVALSILHPRIGVTHHHCAMVIPISHKQTYVIGATYIMGLPCEVVILAATIYHALDSRRAVLGTSAAWPILRRLYTDGAFWFAVRDFASYDCGLDTEIDFPIPLDRTFHSSIRLSSGQILFSFTHLSRLSRPLHDELLSYFYQQWLFCPDDLKYFSDYLIYALQTIVASRFFLALRQRICDSATSTINVLHISHSHKVTIGTGSKVRYSLFPPAGIVPAVGVRHGADDRHILNLVTPSTPVPASAHVHVHSRSHSQSRRHPSWMLPSLDTTTTKEAYPADSRSDPYAIITPDGEEMQMTAVSTREYELKATTSKGDEPTLPSTDAPLYDLEACRANLGPKEVTPTTGIGEPT